VRLMTCKKMACRRCPPWPAWAATLGRARAERGTRCRCAVHAARRAARWPPSVSLPSQIWSRPKTEARRRRATDEIHAAARRVCWVGDGGMRRDSRGRVSECPSLVSRSRCNAAAPRVASAARHTCVRTGAVRRANNAGTPPQPPAPPRGPVRTVCLVRCAPVDVKSVSPVALWCVTPSRTHIHGGTRFFFDLIHSKEAPAPLPHYAGISEQLRRD
jgi:hypothetical protein